ncbi:hypothetical protein [Streptomyces avermitilis]|uniref:hypothetical protein n=1 Tax=Streptomyces avermitilis TaxID=33903 RepID=UPI0038014E23
MDALPRSRLEQLRAGVGARVRRCSHCPRSVLLPRAHPRGCRSRDRGGDELRGQLRQDPLAEPGWQAGAEWTLLWIENTVGQLTAGKS